MGNLGCALSNAEAKEFLGRINRRGERKCIAIVKNSKCENVVCGKVFMSKGAHNRKCPKCKAKERLNEDNQIKFDMPIYRMSGKFKPYHSFRGETD